MYTLLKMLVEAGSRISDSFPKDLWVSRVIASQHKKERVYVTLNGYRWDDFGLYIYKSDDYGKTWTNISSNIPMSPVNVIKEDPENENVLYVGTDNGAYATFNQGKNWELFVEGLPNVAVHDIVIQEREKHLLLGTHGRSIYKANIADLQKMNAAIESNPITVFEPNPVNHSRRWGASFGQFFDAFEPSTKIGFYSNAEATRNVQIKSKGGAILNTMSVDASKGFNYIDYDLTISEEGKKAWEKEDSKVSLNKAQNGKYYLPKGNYHISIGNTKATLKVE